MQQDMNFQIKIGLNLVSCDESLRNYIIQVERKGQLGGFTSVSLEIFQAHAWSTYKGMMT